MHEGLRLERKTQRCGRRYLWHFRHVASGKIGRCFLGRISQLCKRGGGRGVQKLIGLPPRPSIKPAILEFCASIPTVPRVHDPNSGRLHKFYPRHGASVASASHYTVEVKIPNAERLLTRAARSLAVFDTPSFSSNNRVYTTPCAKMPLIHSAVVSGSPSASPAPASRMRRRQVVTT